MSGSGRNGPHASPPVPRDDATRVPGVQAAWGTGGSAAALWTHPALDLRIEFSSQTDDWYCCTDGTAARRRSPENERSQALFSKAQWRCRRCPPPAQCEGSRENANAAGERLDRSDPSDPMCGTPMWVGKRIFPRTVHPRHVHLLVASIGLEAHSVPSSFRLRHRLRPRRGPRIIGPRRFWLPCVRAFLKDCGGDGPEHDVLPRTEGWSTDVGIAESRRRKTHLVLPDEGERRKGRCFAAVPRNRDNRCIRRRDARARVSPNPREQVLSLVGGRRSSSGERQRRTSVAKRGLCRVCSPPSVPLCKGTAGLLALCLDAPFRATRGGLLRRTAKGPEVGSESDEGATPVRVLFPVYLVHEFAIGRGVGGVDGGQQVVRPTAEL